ncbi:MAG: tRNA pseudouridine(38-40) synthase TruA [Hyphomicrobiaceae bacterium]
MPRYKLTIEYDGTPFLGWQAQEHGPSVQGRLTEAISAFSGEDYVPRGAGRTDRGVHATGQVAHIDLARDREPRVIQNALNVHLAPDPIAVIGAEHVDEDFDARFSAVQRHYLYRIVNRRAFLTLEKDRAWQVGPVLDAGAMHSAGQVLVGRHDFTTFRSAQCQAKSPVKRLTALSVRHDGDIISMTVRAPSFMHNQVRSIIGSLKLVGEGKWTADDFRAALEARDRAACGPVAPPGGLYLTQVDYNPDLL